MAKDDYYNILGVQRDASAADIKKAFLKLAKQYHPDKTKGDSVLEAKFKQVNEAYEVLKDEQKRAAYDRFGHNAFQQAGTGGGYSQSGGAGPDINDIFGDFFSDFMGGGRSSSNNRATKTRGADLKYNLVVTLEEAFKGIDKKINFASEVKCTPCNGAGSEKPADMVICNHCGGHGIIRMQQGFFAVEQTCPQCHGAGRTVRTPCSSCHGSGRMRKQRHLMVNIPAGVEDGVRIRVAGEGEAGLQGGNNGDLYVFISVKEHDVFKVENSNLHFKLPISFTTAILGGEVQVPTIEGGKVSLTIPAGSEHGDQLKLRGKGMSKVRSTARGDMYAHIFIRIPKNLTTKQKELVEELAKDFKNDTNNYNDQGFFAKMKNIWS